MPLQNRVDPWGKLHAHSSKASTRMGNRGILHDGNNQIVRQWAHKRWVTCLLAFKGIRRPRPFSPGNYSELFFLDEATAFSAGHRPCSYCQRERSNSFRDVWLRANAAELGDFVVCRMAQIDKILHAERVTRDREKMTFAAPIAALPVGTMFAVDGSAYLLSPRGCLPWSFDGYGAPQPMSSATVVQVLTPRSIVRTFMAGFVPFMHPFAE